MGIPHLEFYQLSYDDIVIISLSLCFFSVKGSF